MILFRLLVFNTLNHVVINDGHVSNIHGIFVQKLVEGFAETEKRNAHYEIETLILSKRNSSKRNTRIIKRNTHNYQKEPFSLRHTMW